MTIAIAYENTYFFIFFTNSGYLYCKIYRFPDKIIIKTNLDTISTKFRTFLPKYLTFCILYYLDICSVVLPNMLCLFTKHRFISL